MSRNLNLSNLSSSSSRFPLSVDNPTRPRLVNRGFDTLAVFSYLKEIDKFCAEMQLDMEDLKTNVRTNTTLVVAMSAITMNLRAETQEGAVILQQKLQSTEERLSGFQATTAKLIEKTDTQIELLKEQIKQVRREGVLTELKIEKMKLEVEEMLEKKKKVYVD